MLKVLDGKQRDLNTETINIKYTSIKKSLILIIEEKEKEM